MAKNYDLSIFDMFAERDSLNFGRMKAHGTICGALISLTFTILVITYVSREILD